jgi:membrane protein YqaA with SNARE-associated domain
MAMVSDETIVKVSAIIGLTAICVVALSHGIDSVLTASISAIIGGIAGYTIGSNREKNNGEA